MNSQICGTDSIDKSLTDQAVTEETSDCEMAEILSESQSRVNPIHDESCGSPATLNRSESMVCAEKVLYQCLNIFQSI